MDLTSLKELIPLFIAGLTTLGGAIVWIFNRMDAKNREERQFEMEERAKFDKLFTEQIISLQAQVSSQNAEIDQLRKELNIYVRHVGILEGLLKAQGVDPPPLQH
jgi:uncharacterized coiled-coil protein SlyX